MQTKKIGWKKAKEKIQEKPSMSHQFKLAIFNCHTGEVDGEFIDLEQFSDPWALVDTIHRIYNKIK